MTYGTAQEALAGLTRFVQDFPAEGVLFEDLTPVLANPAGLRLLVEDLAAACKRFDGELIAGLDARGFLLGSAIAYANGQGILAVRKAGKLPPPVHNATYELEYGSAALEVPADGIDLEGRRVVLVDDVLATGGTLCAARQLLEKCGAEVVGVAVVLQVPGLNGHERFSDLPIHVVNGGPQ